MKRTNKCRVGGAREATELVAEVAKLQQSAEFLRIELRCSLRRAGSSMVEVVVATLISGVVIVGALEVMGGATKTRRAAASTTAGPLLANELLAEIMGQAYEDPEAPGTGELLGVGRESGETTRNTFDDIDDYLNYSESPPQDSADQPMAEFTGWTRQVIGAFATVDSGADWILDTGLKKVTVTVTAPDGTTTQRVGMRYKEGSLEQAAAVDSEIVTWVGAELQIGAMGVARAGTNLVNSATD